MFPPSYVAYFDECAFWLRHCLSGEFMCNNCISQELNGSPMASFSESWPCKVNKCWWQHIAAFDALKQYFDLPLRLFDENVSLHSEIAAKTSHSRKVSKVKTATVTFFGMSYTEHVFPGSKFVQTRVKWDAILRKIQQTCYSCKPLCWKPNYSLVNFRRTYLFGQFFGQQF